MACACKVLVCFLQGKRASHKGVIPMILESFADAGRAVGLERHIAASPQVDTAKDQRPCVIILEPGSPDVHCAPALSQEGSIGSMPSACNQKVPHSSPSQRPLTSNGRHGGGACLSGSPLTVTNVSLSPRKKP